MLAGQNVSPYTEQAGVLLLARRIREAPPIITFARKMTVRPLCKPRPEPISSHHAAESDVTFTSASIAGSSSPSRRGIGDRASEALLERNFRVDCCVHFNQVSQIWPIFFFRLSHHGYQDYLFHIKISIPLTTLSLPNRTSFEDDMQTQICEEVREIVRAAVFTLLNHTQSLWERIQGLLRPVYHVAKPSTQIEEPLLNLTPPLRALLDRNLLDSKLKNSSRTLIARLD